MALSNLSDWNKKDEAACAHTCSTACGSGDKPAEAPAACGAADNPEEKPAACGKEIEPSVHMNQTERRMFLIQALLSERPEYSAFYVPDDEVEQKRLLRSLMNVRPPQVITNQFLTVQDAYLKERAKEKGIVELQTLTPCEDNLYLWQGDITRLAVDAIVNAANSGMTGCYCPCHGCIDNAIHTFSGVQLRLDCAKFMAGQGFEEPTGRAKITKAYNLPCKQILHTVGPIVGGQLTKEDERQLAGCYRSCLALAEQSRVKSIAFCCISTGEFHFPNKRAAEIAVESVKNYKSEMKVVFNVFKDTDHKIYRALLGANR